MSKQRNSLCKGPGVRGGALAYSGKSQKANVAGMLAQRKLAQDEVRGQGSEPPQEDGRQGQITEVLAAHGRKMDFTCAFMEVHACIVWGGREGTSASLHSVGHPHPIESAPQGTWGALQPGRRRVPKKWVVN